MEMDPALLQLMASQNNAMAAQAQLALFQRQQQQQGMSGQVQMTQVPLPTGGGTKKRRLGNGQISIEELDPDDEGGKVVAPNAKLSLETKRSQHCEVEKKRRERMNRYMTELAQMIPACSAVPRKLDKLSILKMAVDHMKNLQGSPNTPDDYKPGFLTDDELKKLIVEAANGFMMIVDCSEAKVLYVSDTITDVLQEKPEQWIGSCLYDLLHQKDIAKVRDQLSGFDVDRIVKSSSSSVANSPLAMHRESMNGLRRSFLCRVKKHFPQEEDQTLSSSSANYSNSENFIKLLHPHENLQYAVLHCTGFIRNLTSTERRSLQVNEESISNSCLVAVARLQHFGDDAPKVAMDSSENEFVTRVAVDGRFSYVDPRVASVLGYLPQDLIGQVSYEYYHPDDIQKMVHLHHEALKRRTPMPTIKYRFMCKDHKWLSLAMKAFAFVNPFSQQVEYVVCTNVIMRSEIKDSQPAKDANVSSPPDIKSTVLALSGPTGQMEPQEGIIREQGLTNSSLPPMLFQPSGSPSTSGVVPHVQSVPGSSQMAHTSFLATEPTGTVITSPAATTIEENAATAQHILDEFNRVRTVQPAHKDLTFNFPGLFSHEVNLTGSEFSYRQLLQELDNPDEFTELFKQIPANPLKVPTVFDDIFNN